MKKTYMKPVLEQIKLETQHLMIGSIRTSDTTVSEEAEAMSKDASSDMWHWMDDEQK